MRPGVWLESHGRLRLRKGSIALSMISVDSHRYGGAMEVVISIDREAREAETKGRG